MARASLVIVLPCLVSLTGKPKATSANPSPFTSPTYAVRVPRFRFALRGMLEEGSEVLSNTNG